MTSDLIAYISASYRAHLNTAFRLNGIAYGILTFLLKKINLRSIDLIIVALSAE